MSERPLTRLVLAEKLTVTCTGPTWRTVAALPAHPHAAQDTWVGTVADRTDPGACWRVVAVKRWRVGSALGETVLDVTGELRGPARTAHPLTPAEAGPLELLLQCRGPEGSSAEISAEVVFAA